MTLCYADDFDKNTFMRIYFKHEMYIICFCTYRLFYTFASCLDVI